MDRQRLIVATNHGQRTTVLPEMPPKKPERQTEVLCVLCVMPAEQLAQTNQYCMCRESRADCNFVSANGGGFGNLGASGLIIRSDRAHI